MRTGELDNGKINKLWQVAYDSGELGAAATSVTISGLLGNTDEEYQLITRVVNGYAGGINLYARPNNDSTSGNYRRQILEGSDTTAAAGRSATIPGFGIGNPANGALSFSILNLHAKSGYVRTAIIKFFGVITTTVNNIDLAGQSWTNTADEITSLVVLADQTDGIGIGSRIILLKKVKLTTGLKTGILNIQGSIKGTWEKIYSTTLAEAATSVTISGLTGNTDVLYRLRTRVVNGSASEIAGYIRPNNDTGSNYGRQYLIGYSTTVGVGRDIIEGIQMGGAKANQMCQSETIIHAKSGYVRTSIIELAYKITGTTVGNIYLSGQSWNNTADEITSLVVLATQANGLGIGTEIILERLNL